MSEMHYGVHTRTCTYLLDEEGVCRWVLSPTRTLPESGQLAIGAQFVACLDVHVAGGLVPELRVGAAALFVRRDDATGRIALLRTNAIEHVELRDAASVAAYGPPRAPEPIPLAPLSPEDTVHDEDDLAMYTGGTLTLTLPLYRPDLEEDRPTRDRGVRPLAPPARGSSANKPRRR